MELCMHIRESEERVSRESTGLVEMSCIRGL